MNVVAHGHQSSHSSSPMMMINHKWITHTHTKEWCQSMLLVWMTSRQPTPMSTVLMGKQRNMAIDLNQYDLSINVKSQKINVLQWTWFYNEQIHLFDLTKTFMLTTNTNVKLLRLCKSGYKIKWSNEFASIIIYSLSRLWSKVSTNKRR